MIILCCSLFVLALAGCEDFGSTPIRLSGIQGQVYIISTPGPIPEGWVPPPLEAINTILVLKTDRTLVLESMTDPKGRFTIALSPGTYYLRVKESRIPVETGPYLVHENEMVSARAEYDNAMR